MRISALREPPLLLDTHAFAWWLGDPAKLGRAALAAIANRDRAVLVSTASIWEMATKFRRGRWPEMATIVADPAGQIAAEGMQELPITLDHARAAGLLDWGHGDPFDRMLAAQAQIEGAILVTADRAFAGLPLAVMWN